MSVIIAPLAQSLPDFFGKNNYSKLVVLIDNHTKRYCYPIIKPHLPKHQLITIKNGESEKHLGTAEKIWTAMTQAQLDRHALLLNLGGGVIGDMGGFCAATYKRGIDFVQIPTTLLSQVDASVGGKLGIDFQGFKNHIGVFQVPKAVLIDPVFLQTLPQKELRSGFAEVVKHCLIADATQWEIVRKIDIDKQDWATLIAHSVAIKEQITKADPTEKGLRKILNFGHTLGHAIETFYLNKPKQHLLHGEAIAVGMICEAYLSYKKKKITSQQLSDIEEFIFSVYGIVPIITDDIDPIIDLTLQDKKNKGGQVRFSLLESIGKCSYDITITPKEMKEALRYYMGS